MQFKDYYQTLGVARDATADDIKKAFRKLARKYHPDVSKEADAEERMKEVNEAHAVLSDPERRAAYDQLGKAPHGGQDFTPPPGWDAGFEYSGGAYDPREAADFSDFFSQMFGQRAHQQRPGGMGGGSAHFEARGQDHFVKVLLEVEDAFTSPDRQISLRSPQVDAEGRVSLSSRTLNVKIPQGVHEGQIIRLAGQGGPGLGGAPAGDLLLEVHFNPHPRFRVEGRDVHIGLPVAPWEAALGGIVEVALPQGVVKVRIPEGAQSGRQLRVRGKGIPGNPAGDVLLDIEVVAPPADTPKARELYETMAREMASFDPRASRSR